MGFYFRYGWRATSLRGYVFATLVAALSGCAGSEELDRPAQGEAVEPQFLELAETFERERIDGNVPGASVAILQGGKLTFARGFGSKDPTGNDPVDPDTLFRIGSVTKVLTAATVLQAVERGSIELDSPITKVLIGFRFAQNVAWAKSITPRHLLTHTSGIVDSMDVSTLASSRADPALKEYVYDGFSKEAYLMAPSGQFFNYSNPNYMLLGLMAEAVSNRDYPSLVTDAVLTPLQMNRTVFRAEDVRADGNYAVAASANATGTNPGLVGERTIEPENIDDAWIRPAGGAWSSAIEMAKLGQFILRGNEQVLSNHEWQLMVSRRVGTQDVGRYNDYGFGVAVTHGIALGPNEFYNLEFRGHTGLTPGYSAYLGCFVSLDFCMITLASAENAYFPQSLTVALKTLTQLPQAQPVPNFAVNVTLYPAYSGIYEDPYSLGRVLVTTTNDQLWVNLPDLDANHVSYEKELVPLYSDTFLMTVSGQPFPVTFIADGAGWYKYLRSRGAVATRTFAPDTLLLTESTSILSRSVVLTP